MFTVVSSCYNLLYRAVLPHRPSIMKEEFAMSETHFPRDEYEAIAMLYVQSKDLAGLSPGEIYDMYHEAKANLSNHIHDKRVKQHESNQATIAKSPF